MVTRGFSLPFTPSSSKIESTNFYLSGMYEGNFLGAWVSSGGGRSIIMQKESWRLLKGVQALMWLKTWGKRRLRKR